ncbi:hypothetical protein [Allochromatium palmeri]|uniref:Glycosyltransferase n=1 Tax=Allochromatium palmeri TaxID=231048 RepID=A0A6N8EDJ2_9GAMM|nr:hypothetical protein [Allochromatium palmeri]MTW22313.1 hypothetical protein [Allochromatium palmeri]
MPAYIYALNTLKIKPDIMYSEPALESKGNVLDHYVGLDYELTIKWRHDKEKQIVEKISDSKYDLIIANSFQGQAPDFYLKFESIVLGIIHHFPELPADTIKKINLINNNSKKPKVHLAFLWDFIPNAFFYFYSDFLHSATHVMYSLAPLKTTEKKSCDSIKIAIPGGINTSNRAYEMLIDGLTKTKLGKKNLKFILPGGGKAEDIKKFKDLLIKSGLMEFFEFNDMQNNQHKIAHEDYYRKITQSDLILPLIKKASRYRDYSISSAIATAYNASVLTAMNATDSHLYHFPYSLIDRFDYTSFLKNLSEPDFLEKSNNYLTSQQNSMAKLLNKNVQSMANLLDSI